MPFLKKEGGATLGGGGAGRPAEADHIQLEKLDLGLDTMLDDLELANGRGRAHAQGRKMSDDTGEARPTGEIVVMVPGIVGDGNAAQQYRCHQHGKDAKSQASKGHAYYLRC